MEQFTTSRLIGAVRTELKKSNEVYVRVAIFGGAHRQRKAVVGDDLSAAGLQSEISGERLFTTRQSRISTDQPVRPCSTDCLSFLFYYGLTNETVA